MKRLYVWRGFARGDGRPWCVTNIHWLAVGPCTYVRRFATHAEAIAHAQERALALVPVAVEVTR